MARKRANKNLVVFLTAMGILLTVVVAWVATTTAGNKDPEIWAEQARKREAAGDSETAINLFGRAYKQSMDVSYLVEAAECSYRQGDVARALATLQRAYNEQRTNPGAPAFQRVVVSYLTHMWELVQPDAYWRLNAQFRQDLLEYARALQEIDAENVLGPISEAVAQWALEDQDAAAGVRGDEALERARELDATHPYVVMSGIQREQRLLLRRIAELRQQGTPDDRLQALSDEFRLQAVAQLQAGVEAHPGNWQLVSAYIGQLRTQEQFDEARAVLQRAIAADEQSPELHAGYADLLLNEAHRQRERLAAEDYAQLLGEAARHADRAIELAPALYRAYVTRARVELSRDLQATAGEITPPRYAAGLQIYATALEQTAGVRSLRAMLGESRDRPLLHINAYVTALEYLLKATNELERSERMALAQRFLGDTERRYPEAPFTYYMRGQLHLIKGERTPALQAFEQAEQRASADRSGLYPGLWFSSLGGVLPVHRLATLYRELNQPGEALRYVDQAIAQYEALRGGEAIPLNLLVDRIELLNLLDEPAQEALDLARMVRRAYQETLESPEYQGVRLRLAQAEAQALQKLQRGDEGMALVAQAAGQDVRGRLLQASLARQREDYETVEALAREVLASPDLAPALAADALSLLIPALEHRGDRAGSQTAIAELRQRFPDNAALQRALTRVEIELSYRDDPAQLRVKLLELIATEPDPQRRAQQYFDFYAGRREYEQAQPYLDELERAQPDSVLVLEQQFMLKLQLKQYERAAAYIVKLTQANEGRGADNAGGATYRGRLALARGNAAEAVREYREAQLKLPRSAQLQIDLARALLGVGRYEEAVAALLEAVKLNPRSFEANALLDETFVRHIPPSQRPDNWESYLEQAAKLQPQHAYILEQADRLDPQAGIKTREQRRTAEPRNVENLVRLAQLYAHQKVGDEVRAAERFQEALGIEPGSELLARSAAAFYARAGRREQGEQHLRAFIEAQKGAERGYAHVLLGGFYRELGDVPAAEAAYERARQVIEEFVADPGERERAMLAVELELIRFYREVPGREHQLITACRWALDKLDPRDETDALRAQYVRLTIARALLALGRLGDAERELQAYMAEYPTDPSAALYMAQVKLTQRDVPGAEAALTEVLRSVPDHVWSLLKRGALRAQQGRYELARQDLARARTLTQQVYERMPEERRADGPETAAYLDACSALGGLYEVTAQYELAEAELRQMMDIVTRHPGVGRSAPEVAQRLLRVFRRAGRPDKAQQIISEFMARNPNEAFWPLQFALLRAERGEELRLQAAAAQKAGRPADEREYRKQAEAAYDQAANYYERAARVARDRNPTAAALYTAYQLDALAAAARTDRAMELFEALRTRMDQVPAAIHAAMIRVYETAGRRSDATTALQRALMTAMREGGNTVLGVMAFASDHLPTQPKLDTLAELIAATEERSQGMFFLRTVYAMQLVAAGQPDAALAALAPALAATEPKSSERLQALLVQHQALFDTGDVEGTLALLEQLLEDYPDNRVALNSLAYILAARVGRPEEAVPYAERARDIGPPDAAVLDTVGWVYFKNGRYDEAEAALKEAISVDPDSPAALYHLGMVHAERGRLADARQSLQAALLAAEKTGKHNYDEDIRSALSDLR